MMVSSELSKQEQDILNRYISRKNTPEPIIPKVTKPFVNQKDFEFSTDNLIKNGKAFYNNKKIKNDYVGLPLAMEEAQKFVSQNNGVVATMPYLIAGKAEADKNNYLWKDWFTVNTEEDVGIDTKGVYAPRGSPVLITLHGGGILTPKRITEAYANGLTPQNAAKLLQSEIDSLLKNNTLPSGEQITIYRLDDLKKGINNPFGKYAVITEFNKIKSFESKQYLKQEFLDNPLVLARAGIKDYLEKYYDKAHDKDGVGCWHRFNEIDSSVSQGRLLFLNSSYYGLSGDYILNYIGRFVGVAPEAHRTKK